MFIFFSREGVTTAVQQGCVLEAMLSTYNFRGGAESDITSLSNCIRLFRVIKTRDVCQEFWEDHKKLSVKRHVQFNVEQWSDGYGEKWRTWGKQLQKKK